MEYPSALPMLPVGYPLMMLHPEAWRILQAVLDAIERAEPIPMNPATPYGGDIDGYWVQFEGEDDLLHCLVRRQDGSPITLEEANRVVEPFFGVMPKGLVWCKPAERSVHYYVGHDHFLQAHRPSK
ncbi:hypothetical protein HRbin15_01955 [bacterium HR15]|nr:hypothetical protein HRbin15_01955 [bacterium HR15]